MFRVVAIVMVGVAVGFVAYLALTVAVDIAVAW